LAGISTVAFLNSGQPPPVEIPCVAAPGRALDWQRHSG